MFVVLLFLGVCGLMSLLVLVVCWCGCALVFAIGCCCFHVCSFCLIVLFVVVFRLLFVVVCCLALLLLVVLVC